MITAKFGRKGKILFFFVVFLIGCLAVSASSTSQDCKTEEKPLSYYSFTIFNPEHGNCEAKYFGFKKPFAEPVNMVFALSMTFLGLLGLFRSKRTTMAFQFLYGLLASYGIFAALAHATMYNGFRRMLDVAGSFTQALIIAMLVHSLYLYRVKYSNKTRHGVFRFFTNVVTLVFVVYPAVVHVLGESSANPWITWLVFDLLWILIGALLFLIWQRRDSWPGASKGHPIFNLVWYAVISCILAYAAWCTDTWLCSNQTPVLAWMFLYGWWNLFMGLCFYFMITLNRFFSAHEYGYTPKLESFPANWRFGLPVVEWY